MCGSFVRETESTLQESSSAVARRLPSLDHRITCHDVLQLTGTDQLVRSTEERSRRRRTVTVRIAPLRVRLVHRRLRSLGVWVGDRSLSPERVDRVGLLTEPIDRLTYGVRSVERVRLVQLTETFQRAVE